MVMCAFGSAHFFFVSGCFFLGSSVDVSLVSNLPYFVWGGLAVAATLSVGVPHIVHVDVSNT